jgi:uncharacterized LabA/DUF88 family protein
MTINILVDYDNLTKIDKSRGLLQLATRIIGKIGTPETAGKSRANLRLYGGWYHQGNITRRAQDLATDIQANFPMVLPVPQAGKNLIASVELAFSLFISPREHLFNTFRIRGYPMDLNCDDPSIHGCIDSTCPVRHIHSFITTGRCVGQTCNVGPSDILYRGEQKLVDTMIATDLFYLSMISSDPIVIVSSDEDFWPAIRYAVALGSSIIHIHAKPNRQTPMHYRRYVSSTYKEIPA